MPIADLHKSLDFTDTHSFIFLSVFLWLSFLKNNKEWWLPDSEMCGTDNAPEEEGVTPVVSVSDF